MNIFEEILWPQFVKIEHVSKLPLNEQVAAYQQYIYDLDVARQNWLMYQNKGLFLGQSIQNVGFLAQEEFDSITQDYFTILQEDGSGIYVTALV
jgi:hypothetical protein